MPQTENSKRAVLQGVHFRDLIIGKYLFAGDLNMGKTAVFLMMLCLLGGASTAEGKEGKTENIILITLDGARTQEIFGGLDLEVLHSITKKGAVEETKTY